MLDFWSRRAGINHEISLLLLYLNRKKSQTSTMKRRNRLLIFPLTALLAFACVPARQFRDLENGYQECMDEVERLKIENQQYTRENTEYKASVDKLGRQIQQLIADSMERYQAWKDLKAGYNRLSRDYNYLQQAQEAMIKGNVKETGRLLRELQSVQEALQEKEDELRLLQASLQKERTQLDEMQFELQEQNARLIELQDVLARKDSAVAALRRKVSNALLGYEKEGLSVDIRNGKVYVSLEEKLLFQSGSYTVDPNGREALRKLARVLEQNPDINIMIEGHTDDVPYIPKGGIEDNWDLSVKRATSIVRILLDGTTIDPKRLTAAGRGSTMPVDPAKTPEARQKNRRTEIILTPKLDEILEILETN